jgi:multidrug efflux pump subunit AcrA (membrane-fusion protein)
MLPRTLALLLALIALCIPAPITRAGPPPTGAAKAVPETDGIMLPRHRVNLSLLTEARIREMAAEEGKRVKQGEALSILYTEVEELERDRATAQFKKADIVYKSKLRLKETKSVTATVLMIDPVLKPGSGPCRMRLEMPNPELRIATGLPVRVRFEPAAGAR